MSSQPARSVRLVLYAVLISLLSSLVPPAVSHAAPISMPAAVRATTPSLVVPPTNPTIPRPAAAQSSGLSLNNLDQLRQQYGNSHQFMDMIGKNVQFEDSSLERYTVPGPWVLTPDPGPRFASNTHTTFTVPPALYQSLTVSASTTSTQGYGYAWLRIRPLRQSNWIDIPIAGGSANPSSRTDVRVALGTIGNSVAGEADVMNPRI